MLKLIFKGAIIGVANIIPGVSGGTMAVSLGIYDKLIHSITNLKKEFKRGISFLLPIVIGALLGIGLLSFVITYLFQKFSLQTNLFFIGLILGGVPLIAKKIDKAAILLPHILIGLFSFAIVILLAISGETVDSGMTIDLNFTNIIIIFFIGIIASATMVLPGISGSMVLMLLGFYHQIINLIKSFIESLSNFDTNILINNFLILLPFGVGVLIGIILVANLIDYMMRRIPNYAYSLIMGLILASPFAILLMMGNIEFGLFNIITSLLLASIGYFIALRLS